MLAILTPADVTDLARYDDVAAELPVMPSGADVGVLGRIISDASAELEEACNRRFVRQTYRERLGGYEGGRFLLGEAPVAGTVAISRDGSAIDDFEVVDREAGIIHRSAGWRPTVGFSGGLAHHQVGGSEFPEYTAEYVAGYFVPGSAVVGSGISAAAADDSVNDADGALPLVEADDIVRVSGFTKAANNVRARVVSRTGRTKIVLAASLEDEAAGPVVTVDPRNLPRDVERAVIDTAKAWFLGRKRDATVTSKRVGDLGISYGGNGSNGNRQLPPTAAAVVERWGRVK